MLNEHREFMIQWNLKFPLDRWYRKKYGIPFMSKQHRESSFLDIRREWEEDRLYEELKNATEYTPNTGDFLKKRESILSLDDRAAMAREFLSKFNKNKNE